MTKWTAACHAPLTFTVSQSLLKFMATELVILYSHLILCLQPSFCLLSFPAWVLFQSQFFTSGGQSIGVLALTSVLPINIQEWFPSGWTGWISLESRGLSRGFSSTIIQSINSSVLRLPYGPTLTYIHDYWKNHSFD